MKTSLTTFTLLFALICINNCTIEDDQPITDYRQLLGDNEYVVHKSRLIFKDETAFSSLMNKFEAYESEALNEWEKEIGFKSLRRSFEEALFDEEIFLEKMVLQHGDVELSREELGFSETAKRLLDDGSLYLNDEGILDMNITAPQYALLVNNDGIVQVGEKIIQFRKNHVKTISTHGGDIERIEILKASETDNTEVFISPVTRNIYKSISSGRSEKTMSWTSCDKVRDKYRLIVYEEYVTYGEGGAPCPNLYTDYFLTLRSLHKSLGQWWNLKTNSLGATTTVTASHLNCDGSSNQGQSILVQQGSTWSCSFTHTCNVNMIIRYDTGPCTNTSSSCVGQNGFVSFTTRKHTGRGANSTQCNVGAW